MELKLIFREILERIRETSGMKTDFELLRKLSLAVAQSPISILITDTEGRITFVNPAACRMLGFTSTTSIPAVFSTNPVGYVTLNA